MERCKQIKYDIDHLKNDVNPKIYPNRLTLAISIVVIALGVVLAVAVTPYLAVLCALGLAGAVMSFTKKGAKTLPAGERDYLVTDYYNVARKYISVADLDFDQVVNKLADCYQNYRADIRERDALAKTVNKQQPYVDLTQQIQGVQGQIARQNALLSSLYREEGALTEEKANCKWDTVALQDQKLALQAHRNQLVDSYNVAQTVSDLLTTAKDNLSTSYLPRLCNRCTQLLQYVTDSNLTVAIDRTFAVQLRQNGQTKPMADFSRGVREITLLCFRVSLSELLYDGKIPFAVMDDAFVNFDEQNFARATKLLQQMGANGQVIYMTCHNRLGALANRA